MFHNKRKKSGAKLKNYKCLHQIFIYFRSAIVTGCSGFTVYEFNDYKGRCACLLPADQVNCYPGKFANLDSLSNHVSSVRRGCFCPNKILPDNHVISKSANGQIGQVEYFPGNL
jgi:hypothetical protein